MGGGLEKGGLSCVISIVESNKQTNIKSYFYLQHIVTTVVTCESSL